MLIKHSKIILVIFLITVILYFTSDFHLVDIEKTAIIVAIGIDYVDDDNVEVTSQIAIPQASDQSATNSDAIITACGKTVFDALDKIALETGWHPKLTFCNLIVFGKEMLEHNFMPVVNFLLTSNRFQNSAIIAGAETTAKEVLSASTPLDYISSFALQKILLKNLNKSSPVLVTDIREFASNSRSRSGFCYMPLIKVVETEDKGKGNKEQSEGKSSGKFSNGNDEFCSASYENADIHALKQDENKQKNDDKGEKTQNSENKSTVFDASSTLVFSKDKLCFALDSDKTLCYNLLFRKVRESFFHVSFMKNGKKINAMITIVKNKVKMKIKIENGIPVFHIDLVLTCEKEETFENENIKSLMAPSKVSPEGKKALESEIEKLITEILEKGKEHQLDLFRVREKLYETQFDYYKKFENNILSVMKPKIKVTCKNHR